MLRTRKMIVAAAMVASLAAGAAWAQLPWKGYLGDAAPDTTFVVPPAPQAGSPEAEADRAIFKATRALQGTPRWDMCVASVCRRVCGVILGRSAAATWALKA